MMSVQRSYRLGVRAAMAENTGDDDGSAVLFRQVMYTATDLVRRGERDQANTICASFEAGRLDTLYREERATGGVEPGM